MIAKINWPVIQQRVAQTLTTPTAWGTYTGALLAGLGYLTVGGAILTVVGVGGSAMALGYAVVLQNKDIWGWPWVVEAVVKILRGKLPAPAYGLITHLPQAVAGMALLVVT